MSGIGPLADSERRRLKDLARRAVGRVSERIRMVLLASRGYSVAQISAICACEETTVRHWLDRYQAQGDTGRQDHPRSGRPRKADPAARAVIRPTLEQTPAESGYQFSNWTAATLAAHLASRCGIHVSAATVRRVLPALTSRWRRPRHLLPLDPAAARIMWQRCDRIVHAPPEALVLCLDESDGHLLPVLRAMWMRRGQQERVLTPGTHRQRAVFGALEGTTGRWEYPITERQRAMEFIAFLEQLLRRYPRQPLLLVLDNASIHKAQAVVAWGAEHPRVSLFSLPAASGHRRHPSRRSGGASKARLPPIACTIPSTRW
jgi:transposase